MAKAWAIKVKGKDVYVAAQQHYGPPGSFTVSSWEGRPPIYSPKIFPSKEAADNVLSALQKHQDDEMPPLGFKGQWEVVEVDSEGKK